MNKNDMMSFTINPASKSLGSDRVYTTDVIRSGIQIPGMKTTPINGKNGPVMGKTTPTVKITPIKKIETPVKKIENPTTPIKKIEMPGKGIDDPKRPITKPELPGYKIDDPKTPITKIEMPGKGIDDPKNPITKPELPGYKIDDPKTPITKIEMPGKGIDDPKNPITKPELPGYKIDDPNIGTRTRPVESKKNGTNEAISITDGKKLPAFEKHVINSEDMESTLDRKITSNTKLDELVKSGKVDVITDGNMIKAPIRGNEVPLMRDGDHVDIIDDPRFSAVITDGAKIKAPITRDGKQVDIINDPRFSAVIKDGARIKEPIQEGRIDQITDGKMLDKSMTPVTSGPVSGSNSGTIEITDYGKFEEVINKMQSSLDNLHDLFANERKNDSTLSDGSTWVGKAAEHMYSKAIELEENYEPIEYSLNLYIAFLRKTLEDYKLIDEAINKNAEEYSYELDVNK